MNVILLFSYFLNNVSRATWEQILCYMMLKIVQQSEWDFKKASPTRLFLYFNPPLLQKFGSQDKHGVQFIPHSVYGSNTLSLQNWCMASFPWCQMFSVAVSLKEWILPQPSPRMLGSCEDSSQKARVAPVPGRGHRGRGSTETAHRLRARCSCTRTGSSSASSLQSLLSGTSACFSMPSVLVLLCLLLSFERYVLTSTCLEKGPISLD